MKRIIITFAAGAAMLLVGIGTGTAVDMRGTAFFSEFGLEECGDLAGDDDMAVRLSSIVFTRSMCGKHILVTGRAGSVEVKVVGVCPGCNSNDIELTPAAFQKIGSLDTGTMPVGWKFV
ncbi:RlpA-like double-psi beta-barrel domain-containing protein [Nocardia sp. NBC_01329]|uniref:RlpA-like double-psi beta-barrel domain-containing protein n=1 Tax=Nocardia sp. NBC_01329 TaxID=2903594 RepID=UPI002E152521|nr:RlpA-like double-psi beta-barrel domain-containing protein [Nocardia sp. NBC_01329]